MLFTPLKPFKVVLDLDTVDPNSSRCDRHLARILQLSDFAPLRYSEAGPPTDLLIHVNELEADYAEGWLTITPAPDPTWDLAAVATFSLEGSVTRSIVRGGDMLEVPLHFLIRDLGGELPSGSKEEIRRALILRLTCDEIDAPLLITRRQVLLHPPQGLPSLSKCTTATPSEAFSLLGIWLRTNGKFISRVNNDWVTTVERSTFYSAAAMSLLPTWHVWAPQLSRDAEINEDHFRHDLHLTVLNRVASAIKARDRALSASIVMGKGDAQDEAIDCLEDVALQIMGAFDAEARIINSTLGEASRPRQQVGWQKKEWLRQVNGMLPAVAEAARQNCASIEVPRIIRNTIHARRMNTILLPTGARDNETQPFIALPREETELLQATFERAGGFKKWGVRQVISGRLEADPAVLINQLLIQGTEALNRIMQAAISYTSLGVDETESTTARLPFDGHVDLDLIRMQLGVDCR